MLPPVTIPGTIRAGLTPYREVFCREEGFDHISRYVTGLLLSPNTTLQGIYAGQIWSKETPLLELCHPWLHRVAYKQRTEIALERRYDGRRLHPPRGLTLARSSPFTGQIEAHQPQR